MGSSSTARVIKVRGPGKRDAYELLVFGPSTVILCNVLC